MVKKMISISTARQLSDSLTVDLSSVFNRAQSGCHFTYNNSLPRYITQLFCLQWVSLDNKLHIHFTSESDRETGFCSVFSFLSRSRESQFTWEGLCQCKSSCQPPHFVHRILIFENLKGNEIHCNKHSLI